MPYTRRKDPMNYQIAIIQLPLTVKERKGEVCRSPAEVATACADMRELAQESMHVLTLNSRNKVINRHLVTLGLANSSLLHAREIFRGAIIENAVALIMVHNHPSGDTTPSAEDIQITRKMIDAGKIIGIQILDHVIIGDEPYSMRESGIVEFK